MEAAPGKPATKNPDSLLLDLIAKTFNNPYCLVQAVCHGFENPVTVPRHQHKDILQLDLNYGYVGQVTINKQRVEVQNVTAFAFYPGEYHEIMLTPDRSDAKVFSLKIQVNPRWPVIRSRFLDRYNHLTIADYRLMRSLARLVRMAMMPTSRAPVLCVALAEVLCYWPTQGKTNEHLSDFWNSEEEVGKSMNAALNLIESRLSYPPNLEELAAVAFMSPRNFVRKFRETFSCAPHQYITAHRVAWAQQLLTENRMNVTEISEKMGFPSIHTFSRWFRRETNESPSHFKKKSQLL
jgi:AraC family transcriptional regulator